MTADDGETEDLKRLLKEGYESRPPADFTDRLGARLDAEWPGTRRPGRRRAYLLAAALLLSPGLLLAVASPGRFLSPPSSEAPVVREPKPPSRPTGPAFAK